MRNWFERWAERPWFDSYDIFLCSSEKSVKFIKEKYLKDAYLLRIACNEKKFTPLLDQKKNKSFDYCFTGSYWNAFRDIELFDPSELDYSFAVYGYGWEGHKNFSGYYKGGKPYSQMPEVYRSCKIVLDDANHVTKPWASVNSRVFDAISAGCMVISNGIEGAEEVFGDLLPTYQDNEELRSQLHYYLGDEKAINDRLRELQNIVLGQHTYSHRARELKNILLDFRKNKYRIAIKVPVPNMNEAHEWGDYHFALALQRRFVSKGHPVRIDILSDWYDRSTLEDDVVIVLRGLSKYEPRSNQINTMWNISHPDKVSHDEYEQYDHVFVASLSYAKELEEKLNVPVSALLQCTDPTVFFAENAEKTIQLHNLLFVGNSRKKYRKIVKDAIEADLPIEVYGSKWQGIIPEHYIKGEHIPNTELWKHYGQSNIVLNDHWLSMKEKGFISNRLFDAAACGATIITDDVEGLDEVFQGTVLTYDDTPLSLKEKIMKYGTQSGLGKALGNKAQDIVLTGHTFEHRVVQILSVIDSLVKRKEFDQVG